MFGVGAVRPVRRSVGHRPTIFGCLIFPVIFDPGLALLDSSSDSESSSDGGSSHKSDDIKGVGAAVVADELHDPFHEGHDSEVEAEVIVDDKAPDGVGMVIVPELLVDVGPAPVDAVPVPPAWDVGVQRAEVARSGRSKCHICNVGIDKRAVRFVYQLFKSQLKYIHHTCFNAVPADHLPHSVACLRFQRDFGGGVDVLELNAAIDEAIAAIG